MASEIRVDKINSLSGVGTVTLSPTGVDISGITTVQTLKVGTGLTASEDGDVFFTGVCTATTFAGAHSGSGANLTNLPAGQLTGTVADARFPATLPAASAANLTSIPSANLTGALPAISGANLTGIAATDNVRTGILDVAGIATFRSDVNIPNINGSSISGRRNILMNGAMTVNQRLSSPGSSSGTYVPVTDSIYTLDRWTVFNGSSFDTDSATVSKSTQSPDGFSSSMKWDIGNTETPSANQNCGIEQKIEGQNIQGLAYGTSSAKTMTLSFHVYSNKTGTYCVQLLQPDGTKYQLHEYTVSSSNTWEKKTITVVGNTSDAINDDNTVGMRILWHLTCGSSQTESAASTWTGSGGGQFAATSNQVNLWDNASNHWYLTGCQLEIGTTATEFEHRGYGEELALCQRYCFIMKGDNDDEISTAYMTDSSTFYARADFPVPMRAYPTIARGSTGTAVRFHCDANNTSDVNLNNTAIFQQPVNPNPTFFQMGFDASGGTAGFGGGLSCQENNIQFNFSAEL